MRTLSGLFLAVLLAASGLAPAFAQGNAPSPWLLSELGLVQRPAGWEYFGAGTAGSNVKIRLLTGAETDRIMSFLRDLPEDDAEAALAAPIVEYLARLGISPIGHSWLEQTPIGPRLTSSGKRAVPEALLALRGSTIWLMPNPRRAPSPRPVRALQIARNVDADLLLIDFDGSRPRDEAAPAEAPAPPGWDSLGPLPVDRAGLKRGYNLPGEGAAILPKGRTEFSAQLACSNFIYREIQPAGFVEQRYETHSLGLGVRRGVRVAQFPAFEVGGQVQVHRNTGGVLNGFIAGVERGAASVFGSPNAMNPDRFGSDPVKRGYRVVVGGKQRRWDDGAGAGLGDLFLSAKASLRESAKGWPTSTAVRLALNLATGDARFTQGNYLGLGASAQQTLAEWISAFLDLRASVPLDKTDALGLPLKNLVPGGTAGLAIRLRDDTSLGLQLDGDLTPYRNTGMRYFDNHNGALTIGVRRRLKAGDSIMNIQLYGRQNVNLKNLRMEGTSDPDFSIGLRVSVTQ